MRSPLPFCGGMQRCTVHAFESGASWAAEEAHVQINKIGRAAPRCTQQVDMRYGRYSDCCSGANDTCTTFLYNSDASRMRQDNLFNPCRFVRLALV